MRAVNHYIATNGGLEDQEGQKKNTTACYLNLMIVCFRIKSWLCNLQSCNSINVCTLDQSSPLQLMCAPYKVPSIKEMLMNVSLIDTWDHAQGHLSLEFNDWHIVTFSMWAIIEY